MEAHILFIESNGKLAVGAILVLQGSFILAGRWGRSREQIDGALMWIIVFILFLSLPIICFDIVNNMFQYKCNKSAMRTQSYHILTDTGEPIRASVCGFNETELVVCTAKCRNSAGSSPMASIRIQRATESEIFI